ncbi:MAG TPA: S53 family peptidase, partial [Candidatus Baltobacteraceae bacterium]|nr:S53 family peptidase [Candidatus Baltobacteraceae bacterium]
VASDATVSNATFMSTYAPTTAQVSSVTNYLQSQGFTGVSVAPNHILIGATGTAAQVEKAFDTSIDSFSVGGTTVYANTKPAYVPQALAGNVVAVLGLNSAQSARPAPKHGRPSPKPSPTPAGTPESPCSLYGLEILGFPTPVSEPTDNDGCLRNYRPADYWRAYHTGTTPNASHVNVAIMTAGQLGNAISDVRVNEKVDNIPQVPIYVKQVGVSGGPITDGPDEWTLDMTASSGMAGTLHAIYVYNATSFNDADIVLMYNHWVTDDLAKIGNSSFGGCEAFEYLDGAMLLADEIFLQGASQGQTMFASSGDTGSFCPVAVGENGVPAGAPLVNWPAASSYTNAVSGTTLVTTNDGGYQGETAWYSTGGGLSQFEYAPYWEAQAQPVASNGESFRGVPDIAMDGDLQTGMILYTTDFGWSVIGGTSLSSPLAAGAWARVLQTHGSGFGFAPPRFYHMWAKQAAGTQQLGPPPWQPHGGFHDVLVGGDGLYTALPGYDYTTGLGSLDIQTTDSIIAQ